ncbi:MAG: co-chaperone DjlA [Methylococcaceae bacterium]|nr:co-chaperone DjlA [Methylococcaceae bacterium]
MSWLGKLIGGAVGLVMGGRLGGLLGAALGHQLDRGFKGGEPLDFGARAAVQTAFFTTTFAVMGHLAKVDGRVTEAEIELARAVMNRLDLSEELRQSAIRLFSDGKRGNFPLADTLNRFHQDCRRNFSLLRMFIEIQLEAALIDGPLHPAEERVLTQICDRLKFSRFEFQAIRAAQEAQMRMTGRWRQQSSQPNRPVSKAPALEDAYAALGLKPSASNEDVKRTYRKLMSRHHPDKLVAAGMPDSMVRLANEKTQQIRKAYEHVRRARNL